MRYYLGTLNRLRLFALDPYDLALSKLERNTQREDLTLKLWMEMIDEEQQSR